MIEAVNSVLSTAPLARGAVEQQSAARSYAANPDRVQEVVQAPYISPYVHVDVDFDKAVLQIRDSETGDVVRQIPSETQLEAYRRAQHTQQRAPLRSQEQVEQSVDVATPAPAPAPQRQAAVQQSAPAATPAPQAPAASASPAPSAPVAVNTEA